MNALITTESVKFVKHQMVNKKERFDIILEPLQAIIIFAFLSKYPIGTKISIHQNVLYIQEGDVFQGLKRWMNNDNKEDLYALYQVFQRFHYFYKHLNSDMKIFMDLLHDMASKGIDNLIETYKSTDKISLLHSLHICKLLLKNPALLSDTNEKTVETHMSSNSNSNSNKNKSKNKSYDTTETNVIISDTTPVQKVDDVFKSVSELYNKDYYNFIYYLLKQLVNNKGSYNDLYQSYYLASKTYHTNISSWIHNNVVF